MARSVLATPAVAAQLGSIQLAAHQVDAAARLLAMLAQRGGAVLADATGMGKTYVAIAVARHYRSVVVVAPAALRTMWMESLGRTGVAAVFVSYEALSRSGSVLPAVPELLILDEAHHARNPRARRYAILADLAWGARVLALSATPIHNRVRDLRAVLALFLGSTVERMRSEDLHRFIVRRESTDVREKLPGIREPRWIEIGSDADTLRAIHQLPPPVRLADGGAAHALLRLGLIRAWSSSAATLRSSLRRRIQRSVALAAALDAGRLPARHELASWSAIDGAVQLGFPEILVEGSASNARQLRDGIEQHLDGLRTILNCLDRTSLDDDRITALESIFARHDVPVVAFTQFADTANSIFSRIVGRGGAAVVTGQGARVASGRVSTDEIVHGFDTASSVVSRAMPLRFLIATDVLSEGLSLRRAGVLVHLDIPWTVARLEQRVGRLRRPGSEHKSIAVYAIGPPVTARELVTVIRALQRKARATSLMIGDGSLGNALPLLGSRLRRALSTLASRDALSTTEQIRGLLSPWLSESDDTPKGAGSDSFALALMERSGSHALVAVTRNGVSEDPQFIVSAIRQLSSHAPPSGEGTVMLSVIDRWLEAEQGRDLAAIESGFAEHALILRRLAERLSQAPRTERPALTARVDRCRRLIAASRWIGAEMALRRIAERSEEVDLDALERLLASRTPNVTPSRSTRLIAVLCPGTNGLSGYVAHSGDVIAGSPHPGQLQSSNRRAAHGGG